MGDWPGKADEQDTTFGDLTRSQLMKRVRSSGNETTEMTMARLLRKHRLSGWRRHLALPGKPDFAWPKEKVALFVDGCFWHGHTCGKNITPKTNSLQWREKIEGNQRRDQRASRRLRGDGWSVIRVWECQLRKQPQQCFARVARILQRARGKR
ncbi:MAG: DNA mismatch endonuclease Vsr [Sedimentisphaerales bacterium]|nr:DNA mismatch endonuclease Vsr [Sedimentisphaerales bacterium]